MPRPVKQRFVCCLPNSGSFSPDTGAEGDVILAVEEYEAIRLIDLEGRTQEECAQQMHVARTTVQSIYNEARRKIAEALVNSKRLVITGGGYRLCDRYRQQCGRGCRGRCHQHGCPGCHDTMSGQGENKANLPAQPPRTAKAKHTEKGA